MNVDAHLLVAIGGAMGGGARFLVSDAIGRLWGNDFPWGTLFVNVTGALVIGLVAGLSRPGNGLFDNVPAHDLIVTGILGGYTTVSSFCMQTINLVLDRRSLNAALNVASSTILCWAAVAIGYVSVGEETL
jgi:CrcB protein